MSKKKEDKGADKDKSRRKGTDKKNPQGTVRKQK